MKRLKVDEFEWDLFYIFDLNKDFRCNVLEYFLIKKYENYKHFLLRYKIEKNKSKKKYF